MWTNLTRVAAVLSVVSGSTTAQSHDFSGIIAKVMPSVCQVEMIAGDVIVDSMATKNEINPFDEFLKPPSSQSVPQQSPTGAGSCFIITHNDKKYIITNNHVALPNKKKANLNIFFYNDAKRYSAKIAGADELSDIAVLEMANGDGQKKLNSIPGIYWADSDEMKPGNEVFAIGHPLGQMWTVTQGIISATHKRSQNTWQEVIQTDVSINQGNSGGPLFNAQGKVVGVNSFIFTPNNGGSIGLNFSVSSNSAISVIRELAEDGKVSRGKIGVALNMDRDLGKVVITHIVPNGPMDVNGFKKDDILEKINNTEIKFLKDIGTGMDGVKPNQDIDIQIMRDGEIILRSVTTIDYNSVLD